MNPVVVVHGGGASGISKDRKERVRQGIIQAATTGYNILKEGGSAVDAVEGAVAVLENDPEFNAGKFATNRVKLLPQNSWILSKASTNPVTFVVELNMLERFEFSPITC